MSLSYHLVTRKSRNLSAMRDTCEAYEAYEAYDRRRLEAPTSRKALFKQSSRENEDEFEKASTPG